MSFALGKPILALLGLSLVSSLAIALRKPPATTDLTLWCFADSHARVFRNPGGGVDPSVPSLLDQFKTHTGKTAHVELISYQALDIRLLSVFMAGTQSGRGPDLAEVEINSVGKYFRPPADQIGFIPLNGYLERSGWKDKFVQSRFAVWSKGDTIYGVPYDLNPCTISYRKDLFDEAGVSLDDVTSWDDYQSRCLKFQSYWQQRGRNRLSLGLSTNMADALSLMLMQQHIDLIDPDFNIHLTDEKVLKTLVWYAQATAGPKMIGTDFNPAAGQYVADIVNGDICGIITPDWQLGYLKNFGGEKLRGRMHMIPMPKFSPDDAPTGNWGGTMIGITRQCKDPDLAWQLIESLYLSKGSLKARLVASNMIPPIPEFWADPMYHQPDAFFPGQKTSEIFMDMARQLPERHVTAYTLPAQMALAVVMNRAIAYAPHHSTEELEQQCRQWLQLAAKEVRDAVEFDQLGLKQADSKPH